MGLQKKQWKAVKDWCKAASEDLQGMEQSELCRVINLLTSNQTHYDTL